MIRTIRPYLDHMSAINQRDGEELIAYSSRREAARANYLMLKRGNNDDEICFRQRLDDATAALRDRTSAFGDHAKDAASDMSQSLEKAGSKAADKAKRALNAGCDLYGRSPLIGGLCSPPRSAQGQVRCFWLLSGKAKHLGISASRREASLPNRRTRSPNTSRPSTREFNVPNEFTQYICATRVTHSR